MNMPSNNTPGNPTMNYDAIKKRIYSEWIAPTMQLWNTFASASSAKVVAMSGASPAQQKKIAAEIKDLISKLIADNEPLRVEYMNKLTQAHVLNIASQYAIPLSEVQKAMTDEPIEAKPPAKNKRTRGRPKYFGRKRKA